MALKGKSLLDWFTQIESDQRPRLQPGSKRNNHKNEVDIDGSLSTP